MLCPQLYACSNDKEACISNVLCYQEGGNDKIWNLRFYRDFHERELEAAFSFLEFFHSQIPRGVGCDIFYRRLNGNGKFDIRSYYGPITIRFRVHLSPIFLERMFVKLKFLRG